MAPRTLALSCILALAAAALPEECSTAGQQTASCSCFKDISNACELLAKEDLLNLSVDCSQISSGVLLDDEKAEQLGACLARLPIQSLTLSAFAQRNITAAGLLGLTEGISKMKLLNLSVDFTAMHFGDVGATSIAEGFTNSGVLHWYMKLDTNDIGDSGAVSLGHFLGSAQARSLHLDLYLNTGINEIGFRGLGHGIGQSASLTDLSLGMDTLNLGGKNMEAFWEGASLSAGVQSLQISVVNSNVDGSSLCAFGNGIGELHALESLSIDLHAANFTTSGLTCLGIGAGKLPKLKSLVVDFLNDGHIGDEGLSAYVIGLAHAGQLSYLDLNFGGSNVGDTGVIALGNSIGKLTGLASLHLDFSTILREGRITSDGMAGLASGIQGQHSLKDVVLNFEKHKVGDAGFKALATALTTLGQLSTVSLRLSGNMVGDIGITFFGKQVGATPLAKLTGFGVDLTAQNITRSGVESFAEGLACLDLKRMKGKLTASLGGTSQQAPLAWIFTNPSLTCLQNMNTGEMYHCRRYAEPMIV